MDKRKKESLEALGNLEKYRTALRVLPDLIKSYEKEYQMKESVWSETRKAECQKKVQRDKQWLEYTKIRVEAIECALAALSDEQQMILRYMCVERYGSCEDSIQILCDILGLERSAVYERYKKALKDFATCLFGAKMEE